MSGTTFVWAASTGNNWTDPLNWQPATVPNSGTAVAIVNIGTGGLTDAIISGGTSITVGGLGIGEIGGAFGSGHVIVGGSTLIGGGGGGTLVAGLIAITSTNLGGGLVGGLGATITTPTLSVGPGAIIGGGGTFNVANLLNAGIIQADGGVFDLGPVIVTGGTVSGPGFFEVDHNSTLEIGSATSQNILVNVDPAETATIIFDSPGSFSGALNLFNPDTHLNLFFKDQAPTGASFDAATSSLIITGANGIIDTIPITSNGTVAFSTPSSTLAGYGEVTVGTASATGIGVFDTTTNQAIAAVGHAYTGPVAGLQNEYINLSSDNLNMATSTPNWFIHSGGGMDAIAVSSGTNVLDGGGGSNFMTGGTGTDTFFVDLRQASENIWSTVNGLQPGDAVTIWGVTPQDFTFTWADGQGAAGFTGLTMQATAAGKPTAWLTLAGYTQADLSNGRLSLLFGTDPGLGSGYMYIHENS